MRSFPLFSAAFVLFLAVFSLLVFRKNHLSIPRYLPRKAADIVVRNATIYTSDASLLFADSMAIRKGRIIGVGNYSYVKTLAAYGTKELILEGKIVLPGFIDSHVHLISGGLQMVQVELHGVNSKDEFVIKVKEAVRTKKQGSWILGGGWNNDLWGGDLPGASWIDDITPQNPVWLSRMDGHMGLANSLALKIVGITKYTDDPNGGIIVKTLDGEPTGLLIDSATRLLLPSIPDVSVEERRNALVKASQHALMRGVTTVVDLGRYYPGVPVELSWEDFSDVYQWAESTGNMIIRVCLFFPMDTWSRLTDLIHKKGRVLSQWIYLGGVKAFVDGSLGSNSALFYEPYVGEPNNYGQQVTSLSNLTNLTMEADRSALQVAIHAIGDRANDLILDMYQSVVDANGIRDRRFRIEHSQHLSQRAAARFEQQSVIASVQPDHLLYDADSAIRKLGVERAQRESYLFQTLLADGAQLAFGSDWPVVDINPLGSIRTAMKRMPPGWRSAWISSECVALKDAITAYTISAARACFLENEVGSLSPGKLADFVVLSTSSWTDLAAEGSASVEATYVGGLRAYP